MPVTIKLPTPLRRHAQQARKIELEATTVGSALAELVGQYPAMRASLYAESGELKPFVRIFVGTHDIADLEGEQTPLAQGDVISIIPPVAGA